ncbi:MAG TPA: hypothetical protein VHP38_11130, partial [Ruminiclostridium sp.]|nr:hypothetical protein [Ruminiclostridium sp.]
MNNLRKMAESRHHDYYLQVAQSANIEWQGAMNNLSQLRLAWQRLPEGDFRIKEWAKALDHFLDKRGLYIEYFDLMNRVEIQSIKENDLDGKVWVHNKLGGEYLHIGDLEKAIEY